MRLCAAQLNGVPPSVISAALGRAKVAREHILDKMEQGTECCGLGVRALPPCVLTLHDRCVPAAAVPEARDGFKDTAPSLTVLNLTSDQRSVLLSNFGANIKAIEAAAGVHMVVENDRDVIKVWSPSGDALEDLQVCGCRGWRPCGVRGRVLV